MKEVKEKTKKYKQRIKEMIGSKVYDLYIGFNLDPMELTNKPRRLFDGMRVKAMHDSVEFVEINTDEASLKYSQEELRDLEETLKKIDILEKLFYKYLDNEKIQGKRKIC